MTEIKRDITQAEGEYLKHWRDPRTYCIAMPKEKVRDDLVDAGFLEWVPSTGWNGNNNYAITEAGRAYMAERFERWRT